VSTETRARIKRFVKRLLGFGLASLLALMLVVWAADYLVFRYRAGKNQAFGQVTVMSYDAVPQKSGKTQFIFHDPQNETCVQTLFPHAGYEPCWYLRKNAEPRTDI
jgi:hypothetical protein